MSTILTTAAGTTAAVTPTATVYALYLVLVCVFAVLCLYWVLASSRLAGFVISKLCNRFLLPVGDTVAIGAINFSFVQGRLAFGSLTYTSCNTSLSVVSGFVTLRYWRRHVQTGLKNPGQLPPRADVALSGVEFQIFNNSDKFRDLQRLKNMRAEQVLREVLEPPIDVAGNPPIPWYFLAVPTIAVRIQQGSIIIAARDLPYQTAITFRQAQGLLCVSKPYPKDVYKMTLKMTMLMAEMTMLPNTKQMRTQKDKTGAAAGVGPNVYGGGDKVVPAEAAAAKVSEHRDTSGWTESGKFIYAKCWDAKRNEFICQAEERHIMRSPKVKMLYVQDEGGVILDKYERDGSPEFALRLHAIDAVVNYGAWANYQRALQQYRFIPEDWKSFAEKVFAPARGLQRVAGYFNMNVRLSLAKRSHTSFRVPYRRPLYPSEQQAGDSRAHALEWLEAQAAGNIDITYRVPWVTLPDDKGSAHTFRVSVDRLTAVSSFNRTPMLTADSLIVDGTLASENEWTTPALWNFYLTFSKAEIFLLYDHVNMFTDLVRSWTGFSTDPEGARGATFFAPIMYVIRLHLVDTFALWLNANSYNIIDEHNNREKNIYFLLTSKQLHGTITMPFVQYAAPLTKVSFDIATSAPLHVRLSVPEWHTLRTMSHEPRHGNFISVDDLTLRGSYSFFSDLSADVVDTLDMTVELHNPSAMLFSYYLKYFLSVKNNYLGAFQSHMNSTRFNAWVPGVSSLGHAKKPANVMDAYVRVLSVGPVSIAAPVDLYRSERTVLATTQSLAIEVRSHASFLSLQLELAPVSLSIPFLQADRELDTVIARSLRLDSSPSLEADGFSLGFYLSYGPEPERETYREQFNIFVGQVRGQVVAGQVFTAVSMLKNFFHHLYTWDDEILADINPYNLELKRNKLRSAMEVDVHINGAELYLAMMDTLIQVSAPEGARIHYDTRHTVHYTDVIHVAVPPLQIVQFLPLTTGHDGIFTDQDDWTDVANIHVGLDIRIVSKRDTWLAEMRDQNAFIAECDAPTGRSAVYLRQVLDMLEQRVAELRAEAAESGGDGKDTKGKGSAKAAGPRKAGGGGRGASDAGVGAQPKSRDGDSDDTYDTSAPKRCGRLYRATLPSHATAAADEQSYVTEPLSFRPMFDEADGVSARANARARAESHFRRRGGASSSLPVSVDPRLSSTSPRAGGPGGSGAVPVVAGGGPDSGSKSAAMLSAAMASGRFEQVRGANTSFNVTGSMGVQSDSLERDRMVQRIADLTDEIERLTYGHNMSLQMSKDLETTSVCFRLSEGVVIALSPNTLSSVHRWLETMALQLPPVDAFWDSLQSSFTKGAFFAPKHAFEILQLSLKVPPLRVEFYSSLGENLNAGILINHLSLALHLDEQMHISGEDVLPAEAPPRRRGLTSLVKEPLRPMAVASEDFAALGGAHSSATHAPGKLPATSVEVPSPLPSPTSLTASAAAATSAQVRKSDKRRSYRALRGTRVLVADSEPDAGTGPSPRTMDSATLLLSSADVDRRSDVKSAPAVVTAMDGKSFLRKVSLSLTLGSLSLLVYESAEPAPSPAPVLLVVVSDLAGTLLLETPEEGRKGAGRVSVSRIDATTHSLLAQNVPELLVNWFFPATDLASSAGIFFRKRETQERLLVAGAIMQASKESLETELFLPAQLTRKAALSRNAWLPIFVLRRNFVMSTPSIEDASLQLRDAPPIASPTKYWEALLRALADRPSVPAEFLTRSREVASIFDKHAPLRDKADAKGSPRGAPAVEVRRESASDAVEMDVLLALGPLSVSATAGYVELERQSLLKLQGLSGKGKLIWSRSNAGRRKNAKLYAELHVKRLTCGIINTVVQYAAVYQRSVGKWITTRNIEAAKRATSVSEADPLGNRPDAAATAKKAIVDSETSSTLFEIVGATMKIDPIRIQAVSDSGCALLELDGATFVYSHSQLLTAGLAAVSRAHSNVADALQHSFVLILKKMRVSLYGTSTPDRKNVDKDRIAEICIDGFKISELMLVQVNAVTRRAVDVYSVYANLDSIDVPFQVGNAHNLGHFIREWTLETARLDTDQDTMWGDGTHGGGGGSGRGGGGGAGGPVGTDAGAGRGGGGGVGSDTAPEPGATSLHRPSVVLKLLVGSIRVHTGNLVALDFLYEVPGVGLELDSQNSLSFLRFSVPRHHFCFNADGRVGSQFRPGGAATPSHPQPVPQPGGGIAAMRVPLSMHAISQSSPAPFRSMVTLPRTSTNAGDTGPPSVSLPPPASQHGAADDEGADDSLAGLFEGRFIVLPDVLCTLQHVTSFARSSRGVPTRRGSSSDRGHRDGSEDTFDSDDDDDRATRTGRARREEHLMARVVFGSLKANIKAALMTKALTFASKLEKQFRAVAETWSQLEERRKTDAPQPSVEVTLNRAASKVKMWYQISVVFSGIRIKLDSPEAVALLRLTDLTVQIGNETTPAAAAKVDAPLRVNKSFRDFNLTLAVPEISAWLLEPTCRYREGPRELIIDDGNTTDGVLFAFMTHLSVSNFYAYEGTRGNKATRGADGGAGGVGADDDDDNEDEDDERDQDGGGAGGTTSGKPDSVSLADVLQSVLINIFNTAIIVQPRAPVCATLMVNHFLRAAAEFRHGFSALVEGNASMSASQQQAREAARAWKKRVQRARQDEGLTSDKAGEFLWTFLQNFSVNLEVANLAIICPFRNYAYYSARGDAPAAAGGAGGAASNSTHYSHAAVTVDRFSLRGFAGPKPKGSKIIARADLFALRVGFGENCDTVKFSKAFQMCDIDAQRICSRAVPLINSAEVSSGNLSVYLALAREGLEAAAVELRTSGLMLQVNPALYSHWMLLRLEFTQAVDRARLAAARARLLVNEIRSGVPRRTASSVALARHSEATVRTAGDGGGESGAASSPGSAQPKADTSKTPFGRRGSLSASMTAMLGVRPKGESSPSLSPGRTHLRVGSSEAGSGGAHGEDSSSSGGAKSPLRSQREKLAEQLISRNLSVSVVFRVDPGSCALFLAKDGVEGSHAKALHDFEFPALVVRFHHQHETDTVRHTNMRTHFMAILEPLRVRLPPTVLEFVVQGTTHMKRFHKLSRVVHDYMARPKSPRPSGEGGGGGGGNGGGGSPSTSPRGDAPGSSPSVAAAAAAAADDGLDEDEVSLPELLNAEGGLGQITIALSIKGFLFELDCQPVTEVLCSFALGRLDLFLSSSVDDEQLGGVPAAASTSQSYLQAASPAAPVSVAKNTRNYLNCTFHLQRIECKVYNRWIKTDMVGVELFDIAANVGRRQDVHADGHKDSVLSGFLGIGSVSVNFAMASLKSWFVVQDLWITRLRSISFPVVVTGAATGSSAAAAAAVSPRTAVKGLPRAAGAASRMASTDTLRGAGGAASGLRRMVRKKSNVTEDIMAAAASSSDAGDGKLRSRNRVTILVGARMAGVGANADLGLVGTMTAKMGALSVRGMLPLDDIRDMRASTKTRNAMADEKITIFFGQLQLNQVLLQFDGKLTGEVRLESLGIMAERSANALLSNDVELVLAPLACDLAQKGSRILFVDTGEIRAHVFDTPEGTVSASLASDKIHGQVSAETITAASSIVRRLADNVSKCKGDANLLIAQSKFRQAIDKDASMSKNVVRRGGGMADDKSRKGLPGSKSGSGAGGGGGGGVAELRSASNSFIRNVLETVFASAGDEKVTLKLEVSGGDLSVALFADVMKDAQWIQLTVSTYELALGIETDKGATETSVRDIVRELMVRVGAMSLVRMVEQESNAAKNWVRASRSDSILEFPKSSLVMTTRQPISGPRRHEQDCWFVTQFGSTILVTLRVDLYAFLNDLADTLKAKLASVIEGGPGKDAAARRNAPKTPAKSPRKPSATPMTMRAFILEPRVNVLENLTPYALNKVFELLKIGDPQSMIPAAVHAAVTANAEKLLFALKRVSHEVEVLYDPSRAPKPATDDAKRGAQQAVPRMNLPPMTPNSMRLALGGAQPPTGTALPISPRGRAAMRLGMSSSAVSASSPNVPRASVTPVMPRPTPNMSRMEQRTAKTPNMQRLVIKDEDGDGGSGDGGVFTLLDEL